MNVRDTEDILDDATKSQIKMKKKSQDPIAIEKKQNVWTIDYKKLNALYEDFVPQEEFSAEQKYFSSSFVSSENPRKASSPPSSFETKLTVTPMPSANPMLVDLNQMENDFKTLFELLQTNSKRESIFYTSPEEIRLTKFLRAISSVRRPSNRDSSFKNSVLSNTKNSSEKVEVSDRTVKSKFEDPNPVVSKTRFSGKTVPSKSLDTIPIVSKTKIVAIIDSGCLKHMTGDRSLVKTFVEKFMGTVRFRNDHFTAIIGYGDYVQGNITICHVYYVEGLGHNLSSVGQFCNGDHESNVYTISISNMAASLHVCLMSKATSTKS
ncbi:hypothetical protein Tco_1541722 [Tanacetum coccineum]